MRGPGVVPAVEFDQWESSQAPYNVMYLMVQPRRQDMFSDTAECYSVEFVLDHVRFQYAPAEGWVRILQQHRGRWLKTVFPVSGVLPDNPSNADLAGLCLTNTHGTCWGEQRQAGGGPIPPVNDLAVSLLATARYIDAGEGSGAGAGAGGTVGALLSRIAASL